MSFLYTHFKITEKGSRVIVKVNNSIAILNQWYLSSDVITVEKQDNNHYSEPYDFFKIKVKNSENESKENNIIVNFPPNKNILIVSIPEEFSMNNNEVINLFSHIQYNAAVDRIRFIDFDNIGEFKNGNNDIEKLKTYYQYDFSQISFKASEGNGNPYQTIKYQLGNLNGWDEITELKINVNGLASLIKTNEETDMESNFILRETFFKISNGYINKKAKFSINVNLSSSFWAGISENKISLFSNELNENYTENGTYEKILNLDNQGALSFIIETIIENSTLPVTGNITVNLLEINDDPLLVSSVNSETITFNF